MDFDITLEDLNFLFTNSSIVGDSALYCKSLLLVMCMDSNLRVFIPVKNVISVLKLRLVLYISRSHRDKLSSQSSVSANLQTQCCHAFVHLVVRAQMILKILPGPGLAFSHMACKSSPFALLSCLLWLPKN
jgi:hypothetical protein